MPCFGSWVSVFLFEKMAPLAPVCILMVILLRGEGSSLFPLQNICIFFSIGFVSFPSILKRKNTLKIFGICKIIVKEKIFLYVQDWCLPSCGSEKTWQKFRHRNKIFSKQRPNSVITCTISKAQYNENKILLKSLENITYLEPRSDIQITNVYWLSSKRRDLNLKINFDWNNL